MKTNQAGIALITEFEGLRLKAYPDPGTGGEPWTIGVGHTGPEVKRGMVITEAQAMKYLYSDLAKFEAAVEKAVKVSLNENEFAALVSFAYNCGPGNLNNSTLLKRLNAGDYAGAQKEFAKWNKAAGRVMAGLTRRRAAEAKLFGTPPMIVPSPVTTAPTAAPAAPKTGFFTALINLFRKGK